MSYKVITHFRLKRGMEKQALQYINNTLAKRARDQGCRNIEILWAESDPTHLVATGLWESLEHAKSFAATIKQAERELLQFCSGLPQREVYRVEASSAEGKRKAA